MPKKTALSQATSPSLVPLLEAEEKHLEELLEAAKKDANDIVEGARREASRRVKAAEDHPVQPPQVSAPTVAIPSKEIAQEQSQRVVEQVRPNLDKAVEFIVSQVWPEDES
jgi:cell division septum initiation protein DivIVA